MNEVIMIELSEKLHIKKYLSYEEEKKFYIKIFQYLKNRSSYATFMSNLTELIELLTQLRFSYPEIINMIYQWPAMIHANKQDLFNKFILLYIMQFINHPIDIDVRDIFINHPKDLMTGIETIYARFNYFLSGDSEKYTHSKTITRRKIFKTTSTEFANSYGITKEKLLQKYPYQEQELKEVAIKYGDEELKRLYEDKNIRAGLVKI